MKIGKDTPDAGVAANEETAQKNMKAIAFFGTWVLLVILLFSDRYVKVLNIYLSTKQFFEHGVLATLLAFFRYVAPFLYIFGIRKKRLWTIIFILGAASILFLVGMVSPFMDQTGDRDQALRIGIESLLHGQSPYVMKTSLGNPPSPLTGALVLALPSYLLTGRGGTFNVFFILLFAFIVYRRLRHSPWAPCVLVALLLNHATVMNVFYGGDFLWMLCLLALVFEAIDRKHFVLAGIALGFALSFRSAATFVIAVAFLSYLIVARDRLVAKTVLVGFLMAAVLLLPVFVMNPGAMYEATLLTTGFGKLEHMGGGNVFIQPILYMKQAAGALYPFILALVLLVLEAAVVIKLRSLAGVMVSVMAGFLAIAFFISHDHMPPIDYLVLPIVCCAYVIAIFENVFARNDPGTGGKPLPGESQV